MLHSIPGSYGLYYSFVFIPAGIVLFLFIKIYSDSSITNKQLIIDSSGCTSFIEFSSIYKGIDAASKSNESIFAINGLPARISEITKCMGYGTDYNQYFEALISYSNAGVVHSGMVCKGNAGSNAQGRNFTSRMLYDEFMLHGKLMLNTRDSCGSFLRRNNVVMAHDLCLKDLNLAGIAGNLAIVCHGSMHRKSISSRTTVCLPGNALLLMLYANETARVIDC